MISRSASSDVPNRLPLTTTNGTAETSCCSQRFRIARQSSVARSGNARVGMMTDTSGLASVDTVTASRNEPATEAPHGVHEESLAGPVHALCIIGAGPAG